VTLTKPLPPIRQTRPPGFSLLKQGGLAIIPRRHMEGLYAEERFTGPLATRDAMLAFAISFPSRLSEVLGSSHPTVSKAQSNWITATAAPGTVRLVAYKGGAEGEDAQDDGATAEINDWLDGLGGEIGGLTGLRTKGAQCVLHYGLWPLEAIVGPRGRGLAGVGLVDPNTLYFAREDAGAQVVFQTQPGTPDGRKVLDPAKFFWYAHHASVTNPYGVAVFSAAVAEALKEMHFDQDVSDSVHNAEDWVDAQTAALATYLSSLNADDNFALDSSDGGGAETLPAASFSGLDPVLDYKDYRLIRALDEMPTTMGTPKAGAQTFTTAEWSVQAGKQEIVRDGIMGPIVAVCNLHFRLQGRDVVVRAECDPIRKSDAIQDANAEAITAKNWLLLWMFGLITKEELALKTTGSGLPKEDPDAYAGPEPALTGGAFAGGSPGTAPLPNAGTTQDERDANK
jgi:hypothetical protein